jgi:hypothetical protein
MLIERPAQRASLLIEQPAQRASLLIEQPAQRAYRDPPPPEGESAVPPC